MTRVCAGSPILAYRVSNGCAISNPVSSISSPDLSVVLDWLVFSHTTEYPSCLKAAWSLPNLARTIMPSLPTSVRAALSRPPHQARWGNYKLFYIADKVFSVAKGGSQAAFYDLSQYFPGSPEPASLPALQEKADQLQRALSGLGVPSPTTLASPLAALRGLKEVEGALRDLPTVFDAASGLLEASEVASWCTPREWISNYQVGHFPELWSYDLASAYPFEASRLLDLRDCSIRRSTSMVESACYGFLLGDFTVYPDHPLAFCSPFLADRGDGTLINFVGTVRDYPCLLDEVRALYRHGLGEFKLNYGWFISPASGVHPCAPLNILMSQLYSRRDGGDEMSIEMSELRSYLIKRVMNGIVGKMLEVYRDGSGRVLRYGDLYNPVYHALCTTGTRLKVFEFLAANAISRGDLVHVGVDGVKATRRIRLPSNAPMGGWRCSGGGPAMVLSPGAVLTDHRGFKGSGYAELWAECLARLGASTLGVGGSIDLRKIFLNQTRVFPKLPRTAGNLMAMRYLSEPIEL